MISADSIKAKLKKQASSRGQLYQEVLTAYGLERTIYRISVSDYCYHFTLKGGIFLYALFDGKFTRATTDIDLLARSISNDLSEMRSVFENICSLQVDDAMHFDLSTIQIQSITEFKEYHGINVSVLAYLDKTKIPISIDIGFGDVVHPDRVLMDFPVLLDMEIPIIYAYSLTSAVSEKFEAIVSLGYANSRLKDFYDIYILLCNFDFDGNELYEAIKETFSHRGTRMDDIVAFEDDFADDTSRRNRWNAFVKKKRAMVVIEFSDLLISMKLFLEPVINAINKQEKYEGIWISEKKIWRLL